MEWRLGIVLDFAMVIMKDSLLDSAMVMMLERLMVMMLGKASDHAKERMMEYWLVALMVFSKVCHSDY